MHTVDIPNSLCYYESTMESKHYPLALKQDKSELEKFALFYEHVSDNRPKTKARHVK